jgi:protein O-GlcNAc transferase
VGADQADMIAIARRVGTDADYRAALRARIAANRLSSPLFDTARFTRDYETGIELMIRQQRSAAALVHIDVPDCGPVEPRVLPESMSEARVATAATPLQTDYPACPLCDGVSVTLGFANCTKHPFWHEPLRPTIEWMRCPTCGHVHSRSYWTPAGSTQLRRKANAPLLAASSDSLAAGRPAWAAVADRVLGLLGGYRAVVHRDRRPVWIDVGCGDGALLMTATDYGFATVGLDSSADAVSRIQALGFNALQHEFMELKFEVVVDVLSMMDVLEQITEPRAALRKAAQILQPGGVLVLSTADLTSSVWKALDAEKTNLYWADLERHHNFSRDRLCTLLKDSDFEIVDFAIPNRAPAQMEFYAVRK